MNEHHDTLGTAFVKAALWVGAWLGTITLADVQVVVSILSGLIVGALAAANFYVTWRDKISKPRGRR